MWVFNECPRATQWGPIQKQTQGKLLRLFSRVPIKQLFPVSYCCQKRVSAVKQRGRENKGPPDVAPKSFSWKGPKRCSVPSIGVIGKSALEIGQFLRRTIWMISGGPFVLLLNVCVGHSVGGYIRMSSSPKVFGSWWLLHISEERYHDHGDFLVRTCPQWAGPLAAA